MRQRLRRQRVMVGAADAVTIGALMCHLGGAASLTRLWRRNGEGSAKSPGRACCPASRLRRTARITPISFVVAKCGRRRGRAFMALLFWKAPPRARRQGAAPAHRSGFLYIRRISTK